MASGVSVGSLASDGAFVYWTSPRDTAVMRCPVAGCPGGPQPIALTQAIAGSLAVGPDQAFWIAQTGPAAFAVMHAPKDGSKPPAVFAADQNQPRQVIVRGPNVYWTNSYSIGTVLSCPLTGCGDAPAIVTAGQPFPDAIAADDGNIYWTNLGTSNAATSATLLKCPLSGCASGPTTIGSDILLLGPGENTIAVDESHVYWVSVTEFDLYATFANAAVHRAPK